MSNISKPGPSLSAIVAATVQVAQTDVHIVHEGWLLKKKRKKLQGYARRYFTLHDSGIMSYSLHQGGSKRDQISLNHAAFSSSPASRSIHIDSGTATFHLRALTESDYQGWMGALRKFITSARPLSAIDATFRQSVNYGHTVNFSIGHAAKMNALLDDMGKMIADLQEAVNGMSEASQRSMRSKSEHGKESSREAGFFGIFGKGRVHKAKSTENLVTEASSEDGATRPSTPRIPPTFPGVLEGIESMARQHKQMTSAFTSLLHLDSVTNPVRARSPTLPIQGDWIGIRQPSRAGTVRRALSVATTSDDSIQWFDADDNGPEEYVIEEPEVEGAVEGAHPIEPTDKETDSEVDDKGYETPEAADEPPKAPVKRRTCLPVPMVEDEMSLLSVLRKNVGKDLSQISLPVGFNEPISILQRLAEDLEYADLLNQSAQSNDPVQRICLVAAFAVSGYASTRLRAARKPFNPMLGETFEDSRFNLIAEKVCHNPPVMACHASGEGWVFDAVSQMKQKFWGRSLELVPLGATRLQIGEDIFCWQKPSSFMRNLVAGTKYLEHVGSMKIVNETTGMCCEVEFKEAGMFGSANIIAATIFSPKGKVEAKLEGKWHESIARAVSRNQLEVLWRAAELPSNSGSFYGFTSFAMTLNEITEDLIIAAEDGKGVTGYRIPVTDSRFRPDQRAMEEGRIDEADEIKAIVEEKQRTRRKAGKDVKPRWFTKVGDDETDWQYAGGYWEAREQGWGKQEALW